MFVVALTTQKTAVATAFVKMMTLKMDIHAIVNQDIMEMIANCVRLQNE